jgi:hypothetical protein
MDLGRDGGGGEEVFDERVRRSDRLEASVVRSSSSRPSMASKEGYKVGVDSVGVLLEEILDRVGDGSVVVADGERREAGSVDGAGLEAGMVPPSLREGVGHGVIRLLAHPPRLVVHDVDEPSRRRRKHSDALRVVEEGDVRDDGRQVLGSKLGSLTLERRLEDPVVETLVGKIDAELVDRVGASTEAGEVLEAGQVEDADEGRKVVSAESFVDVLVEPGEEEGVESFGEVVSVGGSSVWVEEDGADVLVDDGRLAVEDALELDRADAEELTDGLEDVPVLDDCRIDVSVVVDDKVEVPDVKDGGDELADLGDESFRQSDELKGLLELLEPVPILRRSDSSSSIPSRSSPRAQQPIRRRVSRELEMLALLVRRSRDEVVEDVEVSLPRRRSGNSASFEVVVKGLRSGQPASVGELQFGVLAKARGVVVVDSFGVSKRLEDELDETKCREPSEEVSVRSS